MAYRAMFEAILARNQARLGPKPVGLNLSAVPVGSPRGVGISPSAAPVPGEDARKRHVADATGSRKKGRRKAGKRPSVAKMVSGGKT